MIDQAVAKYGVRGLARELGLSPAYVSMLASGLRAMTKGVAEVVGGFVNSQSVHNRAGGRARSARVPSFGDPRVGDLWLRGEGEPEAAGITLYQRVVTLGRLFFEGQGLLF